MKLFCWLAEGIYDVCNIYDGVLYENCWRLLAIITKKSITGAIPRLLISNTFDAHFKYFHFAELDPNKFEANFPPILKPVNQSE